MARFQNGFRGDRLGEAAREGVSVYGFIERAP